MTTVIAPEWSDLDALVASAEDRFSIISPFIKQVGLDRVRRSLQDTVAVRVWTRLSPYEWATGVSDLDAVVEFLLNLRTEGRAVELSAIQRLHAKLYIADNDHALLGSSNLSEGGFKQNVELLAGLEGSAVGEAICAIESRAGVSIKTLDLDSLSDWLERSKGWIEEFRDEAADDSEFLADVQADLDHLLGYGGGGGELPDPDHETLDRLADWLRDHPELAGATTILRRHTNADGQNLMGHVKQSFCAVMRFLVEREDLRPALNAALADLAVDEIYAVEDDTILAAWYDHFDRRATDSGDIYRYSVLRGLLPPSLGGTREGGGGASSTFKRMLPLVARFMEDEG